MQSTLLVTQLLTPQEKQLLSQADIHWIEEPLIDIQLLDFEIPAVAFDYLLLTSQNAVRSILYSDQLQLLKQLPVICVGRQTSQLLLSKGWRIEYFADYAKDLIYYLQRVNKKSRILFLNGNLTQHILPSYLLAKDIIYQSIQVYQTALTPKKINQYYMAVVFFSPSAVISYLQDNSLLGKQVFCIGATTAKAVGEQINSLIPAYPSRKETLNLCIQELTRKTNE